MDDQRSKDALIIAAGAAGVGGAAWFLLTRHSAAGAPGSGTGGTPTPQRDGTSGTPTPPDGRTGGTPTTPGGFVPTPDTPPTPPPSPAPPAPPTTVAITQLTPWLVGIQWDWAPGVSWQVVNAGVPLTPVVTGPGGSIPGATIRGLTPSTPYILDVVAVNALGVSSLPVPVRFTTPASTLVPNTPDQQAILNTLAHLPGPIDVVRAVATGSGQITVSWTPAVNATSYTIDGLEYPGDGSINDVSVDPVPAVAANQVFTRSTRPPLYSMVIGNLHPGWSYRFTVTPTDAAGEGNATTSDLVLAH